ncbi:MAG: transporter substrate-binding domain-containing protein [Desulfobacterales bacterium]|nr:transporter substrate-binding domain-containing protein [Desulfobacterales bacterium]
MLSAGYNCDTSAYIIVHVELLFEKGQQMVTQMSSKMFFWFFMTVVFLFSESTTARPLVVAGVPKEPMRFVNSEGAFAGIDLDIMDHILNRLNLDYDIRLVESSPRLEAYWKSAQPDVDVILTYSYKDSRSAYLRYATESHVNISWHFFVLNKNMGKIRYTTYDDLKGLKVGATTGYAYTKDFWDAAGLGVFEVDKIPLNHLQMKKLLRERFDCVPMNTICALYNAQKEGYLNKIAYLPKPLTSKRYYNTFVKASDHPDLERLTSHYDQLLKEMKTDGTLTKILSKYGISTLK